MSPDILKQYLEYYRDLGFTSLYRRAPAVPGEEPVIEMAMAVEPEVVVPVLDAPALWPLPVREQAGGDAGRKPGGSPHTEALFSFDAPLPANDTLLQIRADIGDCVRCRLCSGRSNIVFGTGNEQAKLVFVGEGPGADEDASGLPFVGRAGQLMTQMIENTARKEGFAIKRDDVYICNVVKCRPPENRTPLPDEMETCGQFLERQINVLQPKAVVALGGTAAKYLLQSKEGVTKMRGNWYRWRNIPLMVTYHPSYLLRQPSPQSKREAWEDLKKVLHFVYD